jgi:uncharacterized protein YjdB
MTPINLVPGQRIQLSAQGFDQNTGLMLTQPQVNWTSDNTAIATVDPYGNVSAVGLGTATITATSGTVTETQAVTVAAQVLTSIQITSYKPVGPGVNAVTTAPA